MSADLIDFASKVRLLTEAARQRGEIEGRMKLREHGFLAAIAPEVNIARMNYALGATGYRVVERDGIFIIEAIATPDVA